MSPSPGAVARRLARLDGAGYAAFLAALARARGDETARADGRVVVEGDGRRVLAHAPPRHRPVALAASVDATGVDAVATTRPAVAERLRDRGLSAVGGETVARRLLYGVDRETADRLARTHLGGALDAPAPRTLGERAGSIAPAVGLVAVLVTLVAGVGVDGLAPESGSGSESEATGAAGWNESGWVTAEPDGVTRNETLAPGLTRAGVVNPAALAAAHGAALGQGDYRIDLTYRERASLRAGRYRTVVVERPTRYRETTTGFGDTDVSPVPVAEREVYADGERRFVRGPNGTVTEGSLAMRGADPYAFRAVSYVRLFLDAEQTDVVETRVEGGSVVYRVAVRGIDWAGITAYSATALVTDDGLVRELRVSYLQSEQNATVSLSIRYETGEQSVDPPSWYPANASASGDRRLGYYPD